MPIYQIFKQIPEDEVITKLLTITGFGTLDETKKVHKKELESPDIIEAYLQFQPVLASYYIPCKAKIYIKPEPTAKNIITVVRQFIRFKSWRLVTKETCKQGVKSLIYFIVPQSQKIITKKNAISFD